MNDFRNGQANLSGRLIGTLRVGDIARRTPSSAWNVTCTDCGTRTVETHERLVNGGATCRNNACGKTAIREIAAENLARARRRAEEAEATKRRKVDELQAAKLAEAQRTYEQTNWEIAKVVRERITTQKDDELFVDPATVGVRMTEDRADAFNKAEIACFLKANPGYHHTPANLQAIGSYLERNGLNIVSARTLSAAVKRLDLYGLIEHRPAPASYVAPQPSVPYARPVEPDEPAELAWGRDLHSGEPKAFSAFEIARMSSDEYRRCFRVNRQQPLTQGW